MGVFSGCGAVFFCWRFFSFLGNFPSDFGWLSWIAWECRMCAFCGGTMGGFVDFGKVVWVLAVDLVVVFGDRLLHFEC